MSTLGRITQRQAQQVDRCEFETSAILPCVYRGDGQTQRLGQEPEATNSLTSGAVRVGQPVGCAAGAFSSMPAPRSAEESERKRSKTRFYYATNAQVNVDFLFAGQNYLKQIKAVTPEITSINDPVALADFKRYYKRAKILTWLPFHVNQFEPADAQAFLNRGGVLIMSFFFSFTTELSDFFDDLGVSLIDKGIQSRGIQLELNNSIFPTLPTQIPFISRNQTEIVIDDPQDETYPKQVAYWYLGNDSVQPEIAGLFIRVGAGLLFVMSDTNLHFDGVSPNPQTNTLAQYTPTFWQTIYEIALENTLLQPLL